ncbi:PID-CTERM protein-sorting domain-containing protein [Litoribaculum gwangyangense]|jgi:uncharacterized membrane protein|uniref:VPEID-CTERM sorting domain-containing protein n=1 Tax=Litoribaculum gwangyangense TaxID=1130722 RepID=A0ABP9C007_9FLAO
MKNEKQTLSKRVALIAIVLALTFPTSSHAWGWWSWWTHKHSRTCGHYQQNNNHDSVPLDGGLGILLLGAAAFGIKKLRENKK